MKTQKYFIPTPLHREVENGSVNGYNPDVPDYLPMYYNERAEYAYVGFMIFRNEPDQKGRKQIFIPSEPKNDHGYIDRVYVITKAGYVTKCSYPSNEYVKVEERTIFIGTECNRYHHGIAMVKEKAKHWVDKKDKYIITSRGGLFGTQPNRIDYLGWQPPAWDEDGYFWTSKDTIRGTIEAGYNTKEHPFLFDTKEEARILAIKLELVDSIIVKWESN